MVQILCDGPRQIVGISKGGRKAASALGEADEEKCYATIHAYSCFQSFFRLSCSSSPFFSSFRFFCPRKPAASVTSFLNRYCSHAGVNSLILPISFLRSLPALLYRPIQRQCSSRLSSWPFRPLLPSRPQPLSLLPSSLL